MVVVIDVELKREEDERKAAAAAVAACALGTRIRLFREKMKVYSSSIFFPSSGNYFVPFTN